MAEKLTQNDAKNCFEYDYESGNLIWKKREGRKTPVGEVAGYLHPSGYTAITINQVQYLAHRIIWLREYGAYPEVDIDHINRNKRDNRLSNLRLLTRSENCMNVGISKANKSGFRGVYWHSQSRKWEASIRLNGKPTTIGRFHSIEDAVDARRAAEVKNFPQIFVGVE